MPNIDSARPRVNPDGSDRRPAGPGDPEAVSLFRDLVRARQRSDRSDLRRLLGELRRLGWTITATAPAAPKGGRP